MMGLGRWGEKVGQSDYCTRYESLQPLVHRTILGEGLGCLCGCQVVERERPKYKYWKAIFVELSTNIALARMIKTVIAAGV